LRITQFEPSIPISMVVLIKIISIKELLSFLIIVIDKLDDNIEYHQ
jgi:hypothetical protein